MTDGTLERLRTVHLERGEAAASWLGQASFAIATASGATILLDPFLSAYPRRLHPSPLAPETATGVDLVLCSHEHVDHLDPDSVPGIAAASPAAVFVVPEPIVDMVTEAGVDAARVVGMQPGGTTEIAGVTVRAVPACHGVTMDDAYGFGEELSDGMVRFLGFVVDADGVRLYHAGDTIHYEGMEATLAEHDVDAALVPINGRDAEREARGIVGNLNHREAAWLASEMGAGLLVPMHHDMFAGNLGSTGALVDLAAVEFPDVPIMVPARDRPFVVTSRRDGHA